MGRGWRAVVEAGLGDTRTRILGVFLIIVAVVGTFLMHSYANIETVFAASLLAGSLLGRWWTIIVPLTTLAVLQPLEWSTTYAGYGLNAMTGITFFVISGYVFVGFLGNRIRPKVLFRVKSVALLTTISVPVTIAYDLWTAIGLSDSLHPVPLAELPDLRPPLREHLPLSPRVRVARTHTIRNRLWSRPRVIRGAPRSSPASGGPLRDDVRVPPPDSGSCVLDSRDAPSGSLIPDREPAAESAHARSPCLCL